MSVPETPPDTSEWICASDVVVRNCFELSVGALPPPVPLSPWHSAQVVAKRWRPIAV